MTSCEIAETPYAIHRIKTKQKFKFLSFQTNHFATVSLLSESGRLNLAFIYHQTVKSVALDLYNLKCIDKLKSSVCILPSKLFLTIHLSEFLYFTLFGDILESSRTIYFLHYFMVFII